MQAAAMPVVIKQNRPWITELALEMAKQQWLVMQRQQVLEETTREYSTQGSRRQQQGKRAARRDKEAWLKQQLRAIEKYAEQTKYRQTYIIFNQK